MLIDLVAIKAWADEFLLESECLEYLANNTEMARCGHVERRLGVILQTLTDSTEAQIKIDNLLPAKIPNFEVTDFDTLTLKQDVVDNE